MSSGVLLAILAGSRKPLKKIKLRPRGLQVFRVVDVRCRPLNEARSPRYLELITLSPLALKVVRKIVSSVSLIIMAGQRKSLKYGESVTQIDKFSSETTESSKTTKFEVLFVSDF